MRKELAYCFGETHASIIVGKAIRIYGPGRTRRYSAEGFMQIWKDHYYYGPLIHEPLICCDMMEERGEPFVEDLKACLLGKKLFIAYTRYYDKVFGIGDKCRLDHFWHERVVIVNVCAKTIRVMVEGRRLSGLNSVRVMLPKIDQFVSANLEDA